MFRGIINTRKDAFLRSQPDKASGKTMAYERGVERNIKSGKAFTPTVVLVNKPDQNIHFLVDCRCSILLIGSCAYLRP